MFTGIIKHLGTIAKSQSIGSSIQFFIKSELNPSLSVDQSVSHDGICLTVDGIEGDLYRITAVKETIQRTNISEWRKNSVVNLETSATPTSLLDGHIVQGHVDCCVKVLDIKDVDGSWYFSFELPSAYKSLVVEKGSIAINGVSLTIATLLENSFSTAIIPYTYENTGFSRLSKGNWVNIEFDIIGKYVQRMVSQEGKNKS